MRPSVNRVPAGMQMGGLSSSVARTPGTPGQGRGGGGASMCGAVLCLCCRGMGQAGERMHFACRICCAMAPVVFVIHVLSFQAAGLRAQLRSMAQVLLLAPVHTSISGCLSSPGGKGVLKHHVVRLMDGHHKIRPRGGSECGQARIARGGGHLQVG